MVEPVTFTCERKHANGSGSRVYGIETLEEGLSNCWWARKLAWRDHTRVLLYQETVPRRLVRCWVRTSADRNDGKGWQRQQGEEVEVVA